MFIVDWPLEQLAGSQPGQLRRRPLEVLHGLGSFPGDLRLGRSPLASQFLLRRPEEGIRLLLRPASDGGEELLGFRPG